jgi:hypothetical protein
VPVEVPVAQRHQGFDKLSPNGGGQVSGWNPVRTEPVEVPVAQRHQGFDKLSPNGGDLGSGEESRSH